MKCLQHLCRVCRRRASHTTRQPYQCTLYSAQLREAFGIDIDQDNASTHPPSFCTSCYAVMWHHEERLRSGSHYYCTLTPAQWLPHTDDQCTTCSEHDTQAKGGRPSKKGKHRGRPPKSGVAPSSGSSALIHEVRLRMARSNCPRVHAKLLPSQFLPPPPPLQLTQFTCGICNGIFDSPIQLGCGHTFCSERCITSLRSGKSSCPEPNCSSTITVDGIQKPSDLMISTLASLQCKCHNGRCNATLPL